MLMLDAGKVFELDADKKERWSFTGAQRPLDAQWLPGDRVLLAEHAANKVAERNRKGEIQWEKSVQEPLVAQRLPNGRTFIATPTQLLEVDRTGKEVWTYSRPESEGIMKAQRLGNGDIALIVNPGLLRGTIEPVFLRLNPTGEKEITRFAVGQRTSGGRIDVMSNGHILVPMRDDNRLVELDATGKEVWKVDHPQPIAAVRLANGHTLINSYSEFRTVEVDAAGKVVWEYKADSRINRTFRR
jgi:outer membrane protein assembly factor BamB